MSVDSILALSSQDQRVAALHTALAACTAADAKALMSGLLGDNGNASVVKPLVLAALEYADEESCTAEVCEAIGSAVLQRTGTACARFLEEEVRAREVLTDYYEGSDQLEDALRVLRAMPTEQQLRSSADDYRASVFIRAANIALQLDRLSDAETYVGQAWPLLASVQDEALRLQFQTCSATVADRKRKFLDAGQRFYQLSLQLDDGIPALRKAVISAVLAPAGPPRSRLLAALFRDERLPLLGDLAEITGKLYHARILREHDIAVLKPLLDDHHLAEGADGRTVFAHALMQHNLLSASRLYYNIRFPELASLLGVTPEQAERIAAKMVAEDRLNASIDQVDGLIHFLADKSAPIDTWDRQIATVCHAVSSVADDIARRHPEPFAAMLTA